MRCMTLFVFVSFSFINVTTVITLSFLLLFIEFGSYSKIIVFDMIKVNVTDIFGDTYKVLHNQLNTVHPVK